MKTPINIFYHVCMINHWREVVREQLTVVKESGLYDACQNIYIGALGSDDDFTELQRIVDEFGMARVHYYPHPDIKQYEFHTLKVLKCVCDMEPLFYGFYIHVKGISYPEAPNKNSGKVWRDYSMHWVIKQWRMNIKAMSMRYQGYDLCAPKIVPKRMSPSDTTHASGNMWAFNSEYIKSLPQLESLDCTNRFNAETVWAFSGEPIIFMPCNIFIDYMNRQPSYDEFIASYPEYKEHCLL